MFLYWNFEMKQKSTRNIDAHIRAVSIVVKFLRVRQTLQAGGGGEGGSDPYPLDLALAQILSFMERGVSAILPAS